MYSPPLASEPLAFPNTKGVSLRSPARLAAGVVSKVDPVEKETPPKAAADERYPAGGCSVEAGVGNLALVPVGSPAFGPRPGLPLGFEWKLISSSPFATFFSPDFVEASVGLSVCVPPSFFPEVLGIFLFWIGASGPSSGIATSESLPPSSTYCPGKKR